jgi:hypothetical protein
MAFVKIAPKSTKFIDELRKRSQSFQGAQIGARIQVPSDLIWWYWLEFGTAGRQDAGAPVRSGKTTYPIAPVDRGGAATLDTLHWVDENGSHFPLRVAAHPGIRPHPFVRPILADIKAFAVRDVLAALAGDGGFRVVNVKSQLMQNTMHRIVEMISESLATVAPGTRPDGKLDGNTAAEVFEEGAEVVDGSAFAGGGSSLAAESPKQAETAPKLRAARPTLTWDEKAMRKMRRAAETLSK